MSGKKLLLDTNAVIALLRGDVKIGVLAQGAEWIGISILSVLEYRSFSKLSEQDISLFKEFTDKIDVIDLSNNDMSLIKNTIALRIKYRLKLPDAIIVATAFSCKAHLVTGDKALAKIKDLDVILLK